MFLPMSWISPLTVAMRIFPLVTPLCPGWEAICYLMTWKASLAASADWISCGRKISPFSYRLPT